MDIMPGKIGTYLPETEYLFYSYEFLPFRGFNPGTKRAMFIDAGIIALVPGSGKVRNSFVMIQRLFPRGCCNAQGCAEYHTQHKNQNSLSGLAHQSASGKYMISIISELYL